MQVQRINPITRWNRGNKVKSQRLINVLLRAKRDNPEITEKELHYVAFGFREFQRA